MKKLFTFLLALIASVGMVFAAKDVVPSDAVLQNYYETGQLCVCIFVPAEMACNDVVFVGTYNRDASDAWITDVKTLAKFEPVEGYDGWYVLAVNDETPADFQDKGIQGKPVVLEQDGNFNWAYQVGDVTVIRGGVTVVPGFSGEIDLIGYTKDAPNVFTIDALKANANPCTAVYHDYTFTVISDGCDGFAVPYLIGSMTDWYFQQMQVNVEKTQELGAPTYYYKCRCAEGTRYQVLSGLKAADGSIAEYPTWDAISYLEQLVDDVWVPYTENGNVDLTTGANVNITFDVRQKNLRWARCAAPEEAYEVAVSLTAPAGAPAAGVEIIGEFDGWAGTPMTLENGKYTATVSATPSQKFKFREAGAWDNEIMIADAGAEGGWKGFPTTQFQSVWEPAAEEGKMVINLDLSNPTMYRWKETQKTQTITGTCGNNLTWELSCDGVLTISGTGAMADYAYNTMPWYDYRSSIKSIVIDDGVTSIGNSAFYKCSSLTSITIPNGVTSIGYEAFNGTGIYNDNANWENDVLYINDCLISANGSISGAYTIKAGTRLIAGYAFQVCKSLTSVTIPNSVTSIGDDAFWGCSSLTSITIPNSVTVIGNRAFEACYSLTSVSIGNRVTSIGEGAFSDCTKLSSVIIPKSVVSIGEDVFGGSYLLSSISVEAGNPVYDSRDNCNAIIETTTNTIIAGCPNTIIPNSVTAIGNYAFAGFISITSFDIPNRIVKIGNSAFGGCKNLSSVTIPNSVISIGEDAFSTCPSLTTITIPSSVKEIMRDAFWGCSSMSAINFESQIPPTMGVSMFYMNDCSIYVPCGTKEAYVTALNENNTIDESRVVEKLPYTYSVLTSDSTLGSVTITQEPTCTAPLIFRADAAEGYQFTQWSDGNTDNPRSLILTQDTSFTAIFEADKCLLASGTCGADSTNLTWELSCDGVLTISGTGAMADYSSSTDVPWYGHRSAIKTILITDSVTSIGDFAFYNCSSLTSITIPNSVTSIGYAPFTDCSSLTSINVDSNNPNYSSVDGVLFNKDKTTLIQYPIGNTRSEYTIPNSVTCIGVGAFEGCSSLTSVTIPNSVTSIEVAAFSRCSSLTSVTIPNSVTRIGDLAFGNCSSLTSITIPNSVKSIGDAAFYNCSSLISITIPNSVTSIGDGTFTRCSSLTSVTIGNGVTSIGDGAFSECSSLTYVTIPNNVTSIGDHAFSRCSSLTSINVDSNNPNYSSVDGVLFSKDKTTLIQCPGGKQGTYTIPNSVTSIGDKAFYGCSSLTSVTFEGSTPPVFGYDVFYNTNNCPIYVPCGTKEAYVTALNENYTIDESRVIEKLPYTYSILTSDSTLGSVTITQEPTCTAPLIFRADAAEGYQFTQWSDGNTDNPRSLILTQDTTIKAEFELCTYTVTWLNYDSLVLELDTNVAYGTMPSYDSAVPAKPSTAEYTYTFAGWSPVVESVTGNTTYIAVFDEVLNAYTVTWLNYDSLVLELDTNVAYGIMPSYDSAVPAKPSTAEYTYTFAGWSPVVESVTGNTTYIAVFDEVLNAYTVTWLNYDSLVLELDTNVIYGTMPSYDGTLPAKPSTAEYTYTFAGWSPEVVATTEDATYTATYTSALRTYSVLVYGMNDNIILNGTYPYGESILVEAIPEQNYQFAQWSDGNTDNPRSLILTQDTILKALFEQIIIEQDTIIVTDSTDISDIITGGQDTIPHVEVQPGGEITIDRDDIGIGVITIVTIGTESGQVHPGFGGNYDNLKNTRVVMEYVLNPFGQTASPDKWYAFAVPFKVDMETGITRKYGNKSHVPGKDFMILEYDSELRSRTGSGWKEKKSGLLEPGHFYMLGIEGNCNRWLFEKVRDADVVGDKEKDLQHYAHGNSKNDGWHGLGNTTLEYVDMSFDGLNATYVYTYDNQYGRYNIFSIEESILAVGQPFFTQGDNDGSVAFTPNNGKGKGNGKKNMPIYAPSYDVQPSHPRVLLTIETEKINATPDRLYITLHDDNQCGSYRIGRDFMRMDKGSKQVPNFWCPMADGTQLSAHGVTMPTTYTTIPLGIFTPAKGEYTINAHMQDMNDYIVELYYQNVCLGIVMQGVPFRLEMAAGTSYEYSIRISRRVSTDLNPAEDTQCDKDNKWYDVLGRPLPQDAHGIFIRKGEKIIK